MHARAAFYDGLTARRRDVAVAFEEAGLAIVEGAEVLARWPYDQLRRLDAPAYVLRIRSLEAPELARLELNDPGAEAEIVRRSPRLDETRTRSRGTTLKIVGWSIAAAASLVLTVIYLVPVAADLLAPLVPVPVEQRLGVAVDNQVRGMFGQRTCVEPGGKAALDKLARKLTDQGPTAVPVTIAVLPSTIPNAIALPGGRIYLFDGLLRRAQEPDEIAGVLAHEIGHVAHRDGMRRLIQTGGSSFLLGLLFGDVTGGATIIFVTRTLIDSRYSRDAETMADRFAADVMLGLGRSPKAMGVFLLRVTGSQRGDRFPFLASHPVTDDRLDALTARDRPARGAPLLTDAEWQALKDICRVTG